MRIGIDLDNTIIFYDHAFIMAARERGLIPEAFQGTKQQVRDHIRTLEHGEQHWQNLQGYVYGAGITHASLFPGVHEFIERATSHELFIVSHKTMFGHGDAGGVNLRTAAMEFLEKATLIGPHAIPRDHVFFAETRGEKINKIAILSPEWFIDDLVEVFEEPDFPPHVQKALFHTSSHPAPQGSWLQATCWKDLSYMLLDKKK